MVTLEGGIEGVLGLFAVLALIAIVGVGLFWGLSFLAPVFGAIFGYVMGAGVLVTLIGAGGHWLAVGLTGLGLIVGGLLMWMVAEMFGET
ncbi:hypothetical protein [Kribbella sp. NPDC051770]|uniref:hypothetical protein n=1 Tax=Kribbella sp. NPDC051770 TaxID=3155413 RepID=UPI003416137D